ncbi:hypothetical protein V5799_006434 [Amblyomma americanum]|uniref:Uncharacterized protein n=1 Tax=Amblyomma americanum TaxID=6943 RepID=A0AAQ4DWE0_AMBAM
MSTTSVGQANRLWRTGAGVLFAVVVVSLLTLNMVRAFKRQLGPLHRPPVSPTKMGVFSSWGIVGHRECASTTRFGSAVLSTGTGVLFNDVMRDFDLPHGFDQYNLTRGLRNQVVMRVLWMGQTVKQAVDWGRLHHQLIPETLYAEKLVSRKPERGSGPLCCQDRPRQCLDTPVREGIVPCGTWSEECASRRPRAPCESSCLGRSPHCSLEGKGVKRDPTDG